MVADRNKTKEKKETRNGDHTTRTTTITFRVYESSIRKLREEAENREISLNTLVNQIFKRYVEWGTYEPKVGMIPIAKPVVVQLFENISEEKIIEIATKVGKGAVKDIALFMKHSIDIDSFLEWFETRMKTASVEISHQRLYDDDSNISTHSYIIRHDFGRNWSVFHKTIFESILQEMLNKPLKIISVTPTMLSFSFDE
ncbi:MAG: hypothetical protein ACRD8Z_06010 [Nitrososphaeraceae archaeon]